MNKLDGSFLFVWSLIMSVHAIGCFEGCPVLYEKKIETMAGDIYSRGGTMCSK